MIVKTKNPIRIISNSKDNYSNIDAKNKDEVKAFQDWLDTKYPNGWATKPDGTKYVVGKNVSKGYGNYGVSTSAAYITDGAEWEKTRPKKDEPKKDEPKKDEPKKDEPKKDEPKKDEPKKEETKKEEITVTKDDKGNTITTTKKADGIILTVVTDKNGKQISKKESGMSKKLKIGLMIGGGVLVLLIMAVIIKQSQK
jgi:hypothetical protein